MLSYDSAPAEVIGWNTMTETEGYDLVKYIMVWFIYFKTSFYSYLE